LAKYFAPFFLSKIGRIAVLVTYLVLIIVAIYGTTQIEIHFEIDYFISEGSTIASYYDKSDEYYNQPGEFLVVYVEPTTGFDMTSVANQMKLQ